MSRTPREVPFDVVFAILKRLEDTEDWVTLSRCALTCHLWYPEVLKIMASRATVQPPHPRGLETNQLIQRCRDMMQKPPLDLSYIVCLQIDNRGKAIRHSWLHPVLTSLPRLQYLHIKLDSRRTFSFHSGPASPTPLKPLEFVRIEGYYVLHRYKDAFDLSQYFANAKSITIKAVRVDTHFDEDLPVNRDLAPRSVYIGGDEPMFLRPWITIYSEPTAVHAIRHLRLAFRKYSHLHRAGFISFLRSLSHLETIEFDFFTDLNMPRWAPTPIETQCRVIENELSPAFPHTLHTLCLRLSEVPWWKFAHWDVCLSLLKAVPDTIQHVEVRVSDCNKYFGVEPFAWSLKRLSGLRALQVVLDEKEVMDKSVEDIAEYRAFLCNGFPELAAQGALRLSSEIRTIWQDSA